MRPASSKTLTTFMTKLYDISFPIYDLTIDAKPDPLLKTLFQTCVTISSLVQTREIEGTEREAPGTALGIWHVHESYF